VALTGILCPIGISLIYLKFAYGYSSIEAFAAGASLSSTSMGTTYAVLSAANLSQSKVGVVLVSAALIDDIVGLVIAGIISLLASSENSVNLGWTIARPLVASVGVITLPVVITRYLLGPIYLKLSQHIRPQHLRCLNLFIIISLLSAMTTIANYAGTSSLLGGFVAGMMIGYLDAHNPVETAMETDTLKSVFNFYISPLQKTLLEPLFFASIGFAIPISELFTATVAWRGIAFGLISIITKSVTGLWILLWPTSAEAALTPDVLQLETNMSSCQTLDNPAQPAQPANSLPQSRADRKSNCTRICRVPDEHSVLVSLLLGMSMIARGEIGLLISNIAYTQNGPLQQESFLVCIWAILICTVIGPIGVGILARRRHPHIMAGHWGKLAAAQ
jgi:Kef-type K+ transport system membrane component KefB